MPVERLDFVRGVSMSILVSDSLAEYTGLHEATDFFNQRLFGGELNTVFLTLRNYGKNTLGYFYPNRFVQRQESTEKAVHELSLCPVNMAGRTDEDILSTLVHELCHLWQQQAGTPSRNGYHNMEWVRKMEEIGLRPFSNKDPERKKQTGQSIDHEIILGGPFQVAYRELQERGWHLLFQENPDLAVALGKVSKGGGKKKVSKVKYTCPGCGTKAWGKPGLSLVCGECSDFGNNVIAEMEEATDD